MAKRILQAFDMTQKIMMEKILLADRRIQNIFLLPDVEKKYPKRNKIAHIHSDAIIPCPL